MWFSQAEVEVNFLSNCLGFFHIFYLMKTPWMTHTHIVYITYPQSTLLCQWIRFLISMYLSRPNGCIMWNPTVFCCTTRGSHRWQKPIWMWRTNLSLVQGKLMKLFKITMINCRNPTIFRELDIVPKIVCGFASCTSHVFPSRVGLPTCTSCKATAKFFNCDSLHLCQF